MDRRCFTILYDLLRTIAGLMSTEVVDVEEMVAMFLHIVAYDVKNRVIQREFMRLDKTIFCHFNMVLLAVTRLHDELLKKPQPVPNDCTNRRWRWFEVHISLHLRTFNPTTLDFLSNHQYALHNCLGALDGTYIKVNVPASNRVREITNFDIEDDIDEVDSTHATTATNDIHYIETSKEWTQWRDDLAEEMFSDWELCNQ
ncbi:putative nuclease HARBI1 [Cucumis melo var. makuwa]|uniref:Nuclease HARBI1 n=1 Tax=Cucumis melo var. makuwa TaxID=1194695 RepID=A0A5A7V2D2_CUCMM|nr:putative nuclease HARBI1 [Cucumis melo var. makuwa]TYK02219.1 putative nuclease HARBI1 [Cucumis melo var. makuwa]